MTGKSASHGGWRSVGPARYLPPVGLLDKFIAKLAKGKGLLKCPRCGEKAGRISAGDEVVVCGACDYRGSVTEWAMRGVSEQSGAEVDPDQAPEGTKILRRELGGKSVAWEVPPTGKGGGLLGFGILWTGFVAVFTAVFGTAAFAGKVEGDGPAWLPVVLLIPFWLVGFVMLYFGLRFKYARHLVVVDLRQVVLVRSLFNRTKRRTLERNTMRSVEKREFYKQNYQPVYGIELKGEDGKLRFGTTLTEEEKDWLVADIRRTLWPDARRVESATAEEGEGPRLSMRASARSFTVDLRPAKGSGQWLGMAFGGVVIGGFIAIGIFALKDAGFFRYLWLGFNGLFACGMLLALVRMIRIAGVTIRVSGDRSEIRVQRMKGPRRLGEKRMPREGVEVRSFASGRSNQTPMKRVELVGPHDVLPVVKWRDAGDVDEFVRELRRYLG